MTGSDRTEKPYRKIGNAGIGAAVGVGIAAVLGDGDLAKILGAVAGAAVVVLVEWGLGVRRRLQRLEKAERDLAHANQRVEQVLDVTQQQVEAAKREAAVSSANFKVWSEAYIETQKTGHIVPLAAILERLKVTQQVQGLMPFPDSDQPPEAQA